MRFIPDTSLLYNNEYLNGTQAFISHATFFSKLKALTRVQSFFRQIKNIFQSAQIFGKKKKFTIPFTGLFYENEIQFYTYEIKFY